MHKILLTLFFSAIFFYQVCMVQNQCVENHLSLSDEEENPTLWRYLEKLEFYTGLSRNKPTIHVDCLSPICVVNSSGPAIWEARMNFYTPYVVNSSIEERSPTLKGCVCHSQSREKFQTCMQTVRKDMIVTLETTLIEDFRRIVESNECSSYNKNCL